GARYAQSAGVMTQKLWIFPKYSRNGASSRLRFYQYVEELERNGFEVNARPLFDDDYLSLLYSGGRSPFYRVLARFFERTVSLRSVRGEDIVLIEGELFPWLPAFIELLMLRR